MLAKTRRLRWGRWTEALNAEADSGHLIQGAQEEGEKRYRSLYEETPVMMHSIDQNGRLISVNNRWLDVLGYGRGEVLGKLSTDFLTAVSRQRAIDVELPKFFETGVARDVKYQMVRKNGEIVDVLFSATSERDAEGEGVSSRCFIVDETQRKRNLQLTEEAVRQVTVTEERNRIAREIHDTLAQSLTGIEIQLDSATEMLAKDPTGARAEIASASQLAHQSLEEARRTIWELHPPTLVSGVSNQRNWDPLRPERSGVRWRLGELPQGPVVTSASLDGLSLHLLPAS